MSAQNTLDDRGHARRERGAFEYLPEAVRPQRAGRRGRPRAVEPSSEAARGSRRRAEDVERLPLIGRSPAMQEIYRTIARPDARPTSR
jgi:two-component system nitrogen regulation response regulator GlnG